MKISGEAQRLRIFVGEADHWHHEPLYHAIVKKAKEMGMAGATVMRAFEGFGPSSRLRTANLLDLSADLPVVVEIVDSREYIERFLPVLDQMVDAGLITLDPVHVVKYAQKPEAGHVDPEGPASPAV
ncbi:conserved protein of unknown function [Candidatus Hydrogenisulfobacillus filiaventi]|uniref:Uncharacterized protein n=1 Tax=Candidatus Hydrogenisulfobacillus filiaventi TaxID=2707344 RepID=A0A6F8ZH62_9FIRM|nr:DUF190 domain-containing protein [Bacillota bacterium]CAB1129325.1 conserved protein of unknown function [Candidatus Hydrogenisulfobacillus filiaventi]